MCRTSAAERLKAVAKPHLALGDRREQEDSRATLAAVLSEVISLYQEFRDPHVHCSPGW